MTIDELAASEEQLQIEVILLYDQPQSSEATARLGKVFSSYSSIHQAYATLSKSNREALKRGLFLQWYALTEPSYLTGLSTLDESAQKMIMYNLNELITSNDIDDELAWMLGYYANWEWTLELLSNPNGLSRQVADLPISIDREAMQQRGQMGIYWNSLNRFKA